MAKAYAPLHVMHPKVCNASSAAAAQFSLENCGFGFGLVFIILNFSILPLRAETQNRTTLTAIKAKCPDDEGFRGESGADGNSFFSTLLAGDKETSPKSPNRQCSSMLTVE